MEAYLSFIPSLCLGIALSSAAGFRVFLPLLVVNLSTKMGFMPFEMGQNFHWLTSHSATVILAAATLAEMAAYYIPVVDNLLDTIATPAAAVAGTLLTTSILQIDDPALRWGMGMVTGGGIAGTIAAGSSILRLASTKFTGGLGNPVFATIENGASVLSSILAFFIPVLLACVAFLLTVFLVKKLVRKSRN